MTYSVITTPGAGNFTVPAGVVSLQVECYGGGGCASEGGFLGSFGGNGGDYALSTVAVTPGQVIPYSVAAKQTTPVHVNSDNTWVGSNDVTNPACIAFAASGVFQVSNATSKGDTVHLGGVAGWDSASQPHGGALRGPGIGGGGGGGGPAGPGGRGAASDCSAGGAYATGGGGGGASNGGTDGIDGTFNTGGTGGTGPENGGRGGNNTQAGSAGQDGFVSGGTITPGGGGGSGAGNVGGAGGKFGGGGGATGTLGLTDYGPGGTGGQGAIIFTWPNPPPPPPPPPWFYLDGEITSGHSNS